MAGLHQGDSALLDIASRVGRSGDDLGSGVRHGAAVPTPGRFDLPGLDRTAGPPGREAFAEATMRDVAISRASAGQGRGFAASYMSAGFMLASPDKNGARNAEQVASARSATTQDLQDVLRATARRRGSLEMNEPRQRAQAIASDPRHATRMAEFYGRVPGRTAADGFEDFAKEVSTWNFSRQRAAAERRESYPDGKVVSPAFTASEADRRSMAALGRGYVAIASELRGRGVMPEVMMKGAQAARAPVDNRQPQRGRLIRDGAEL